MICPRCWNPGIKSDGKCRTCGLQTAGFSLSKGIAYERETGDWYEYVRINEPSGNDDRDSAGV
jgi:hypothetical protein